MVNQIPLSCGKQYVGQTGRCLNDRLREHFSLVKKGNVGWLTMHCRACGCALGFGNTKGLLTNRDELTRLIVDAAKIAKLGSDCVSMPSLSEKELYFLNMH